jgi:hypothetical protein
VSAPRGASNGGGGVIWHRALAPGDLPEGRVTAVEAGPHTVASTHFEGRHAAFSNRCRTR